LGWGIWTVGMVFEVVADFQKSAFRNEPTNKVVKIDSDYKKIHKFVSSWFLE
jgi:steroid 5-alpha reductase family enzyme